MFFIWRNDRVFDGRTVYRVSAIKTIEESIIYLGRVILLNDRFVS